MSDAKTNGLTASVLRHGVGPPAGESSSRTLLFLVFGLAGLIQVIFFALGHRSLQPHYFDRAADLRTNCLNPISQDASQYYGSLAQNLLDRGAYEDARGLLPSHMPGIPALLVFSKQAVGHLGLYGLAQTLVLYLGALGFCSAAVQRHNPWIVAVAAFLFLVHPLTLYSSWTVNSDSLFAACTMVSVALLPRVKPGVWRAAAAGSVMGLGGYFREVALIAAIGAAGGLAAGRPGKVARCLAYLAGFLLVLSPWAVRNSLRTGTPSIFPSKGAQIFFQSSLGVTRRDIDPFDIDEGGVAGFENLGPKATSYLAAHGFGPDNQPDTAFYVREGVMNYLADPLRQIPSLGLKLANLLRPAVARRHLMHFFPRPAATWLFVLFFVLHAALVWGGLWRLFSPSLAGSAPLRGMILATTALALTFWAEPRYLMPFYLPLFVLAIEDWNGRLTRAARPPMN